MFVHGLNGNPLSTWKNDTTGFYWPAQLRADIPGARIIIYGYDVAFQLALSRNRITIEGIARMFLGSLLDKRSGDLVSLENHSQTQLFL